MKHEALQINPASPPPPTKRPASGTFPATPASTSVTSRVPIPLANAIDLAASAAGLTRSETIAYVLEQAFNPRTPVPVPVPRPKPEPTVRVRVPRSLVPSGESHSQAVVEILRAHRKDPRAE